MDSIDAKIFKRLALMITAAIIYHRNDGLLSYAESAEHAIDLLDWVSNKLEARERGDA